MRLRHDSTLIDDVRLHIVRSRFAILPVTSTIFLIYHSERSVGRVNSGTPRTSDLNFFDRPSTLESQLYTTIRTMHERTPHLLLRGLLYTGFSWTIMLCKFFFARFWKRPIHRQRQTAAITEMNCSAARRLSAIADVTPTTFLLMNRM